MRIAVMILCAIGALSSGFLGLKWVSDANKANELLKVAERLGVAKDEIAKLKSVKTAGYLLMLSAVGAIGAAVAVHLRKEKVAGGVLLAAALIPALFAAKSLVFTIFLLVAGGLCFAIKPPAATKLFDTKPARELA